MSSYVVAHKSLQQYTGPEEPLHRNVKQDPGVTQGAVLPHDSMDPGHVGLWAHSSSRCRGEERRMP